MKVKSHDLNMNTLVPGMFETEVLQTALTNKARTKLWKNIIWLELAIEKNPKLKNTIKCIINKILPRGVSLPGLQSEI